MKRPVRLMREIRFSIDRDWARAAHGDSGFEGALPVTNSWGGWPSAVGVAPYLILRIVVSGEPDAVTGYLVNIQELDMLLRRHAIPIAAQKLSEVGVALTGEGLLRDIYQVSRPRCRPAAVSKASHFSHALFVLYDSCRRFCHGRTDTVFQFSIPSTARPSMFNEENCRIFGKCNNPNGGHNYQIEVTVTGDVTEKTGSVLPLPAFESLVKREVIDRFDHKHLNSDTAEFAALNPSVENIARTVWDLLESKVAPARLRRVRVWETAKTYAEYSA
jgi:6-pyruvoyltetrahydropterin/6-carboxytetrahydropterin synthase